ncbi:unnamed protein product, partial [Effrenium voratum]
MRVEDGETDEEKELTEALGNPALVQQRQEELARSVGLVKEQLPELLQRIRKRLRVARQKLHFAHFTQCDAQDEGELEVQDILKLLEDLRALPETEEARSDFARWLLSTVKGKEQKPAPSASQAPPAPAPPVPAVPAVGEKQRSHKRASTLTVAKAKRLARSGSKSPSWSEDMDEVVHTPRSVSIDPRAYGEKTEAEKRSGSKELFMEDVALEDLPRMLTEVRFDKFEFEVMVDFLHEAHGRLAASRQLQIAEDFGLSRGLFQEFRKELETMRDLFYSFDDTRSGVLKKVEVWVALSNLGLLPATDQNKMIMLVMINVACDGIQSPLCARFRSSVPRKSARWQGTRGALKALLQSSEFLTLASQCGPLDEGCMDFPGFLQLVQTVRQMQSRSLREELAPLFERMLRRRKKSVNFGCDAVGMPEVSQALEVLQLGPKHREDQTKIFEFLNEVNEFGFKPLTLDFEAFVRFVRQAKEWEATRTRVDDREYGKGLGLKDGMVDEYRVIFDVIDSSGGGDLDLIGVKRACGLLGLKSLTFDELKELFETLDIDKSGTISFLEFLHMTLLVNPGKQRFRAPAVPPVRRMAGPLRPSIFDFWAPGRVTWEPPPLEDREADTQLALAAVGALVHDYEVLTESLQAHDTALTAVLAELQRLRAQAAQLPMFQVQAKQLMACLTDAAREREELLRKRAQSSSRISELTAIMHDSLESVGDVHREALLAAMAKENHALWRMVHMSRAAERRPPRPQVPAKVIWPVKELHRRRRPAPIPPAPEAPEA